MTQNNEGPAAARWFKLDSSRKTVLDRARKCAEVTIPSLLPPEGKTENDQLLTPFQSVGARTINNLASKLILALYPPNSPYFRLDVSDMVLDRIAEESGDSGLPSKIRQQLAQIEGQIIKYHEAKSDRVVLFEACRLLIATGNVLIFQDPSNYKLRYFRLDQYCVRRAPDGEPIEIIVREFLYPEELPRGFAAADDKPVPLYSWATRSRGKWSVHQEIGGVEVPGTKATYAQDEFPFLALAWSLHPGDNYGRGHVEENLGDFLSLEGLRKAFLEGAAAMAKLVFLVSPNGVTKKQDLVRCPNGGFVVGRAEDVTTLQADKVHDFQFVQSEIIRLESALSKAFLLVESIQRDAERVTAEEIRMMAADLDDTLGGIYTRLAQDLQRPLLLLRMDAMRREKELPPLPEDIAIIITTGLEALGRGHELLKLQQFLAMLEPLGPNILGEIIQLAEYARRVATGLGLNTEGLIPSEEELQQMLKQKEMMALFQKIAPALTKQLAQGAQGATEGGGVA